MTIVATVASMLLPMACSSNPEEGSGGTSSSPPDSSTSDAGEVSPDGSDSILFGVISAITGASATSGVQIKNAIEIAVDEINSSGGLLGRTVDLRIQDAQCQAGPGVSAANNLIEQGVDFVLGPVCSSACLSAMPLLAKAQIPGMTAVCTSPKVTEGLGTAGGNPWYYRIVPADDYMAAAQVKVLWEDKDYRTFSVVARDDDLGRGSAEAFVAEIKARGGEILTEDYFKPDTTEFSTVLTKVKDRNPDTIVVVAQTEDVPPFLREYRSLGLDIPLSGRLEMFYDQAIEAVGGLSNLNGSIEVNPWFVFADDEESIEFVTKYEDKFNEEPLWQALYAYVGAQIFFDAVERAGSTDGQALVDAIDSSKLSTPIGNIVWDEHNQNQAEAYIAEIIDGIPTVIARVTP